MITTHIHIVFSKNDEAIEERGIAQHRRAGAFEFEVRVERSDSAWGETRVYTHESGEADACPS